MKPFENLTNIARYEFYNAWLRSEISNKNFKKKITFINLPYTIGISPNIAKYLFFYTHSYPGTHRV